jgi:hypothetical protein
MAFPEIGGCPQDVMIGNIKEWESPLIWLSGVPCGMATLPMIIYVVVSGDSPFGLMLLWDNTGR